MAGNEQRGLVMGIDKAIEECSEALGDETICRISQIATGIRDMKDKLSEENCVLIKQRDALLEALELAEPLVERCVDISGYKTHKERAVLVLVRSAIKQAKGQ